MGKIFVLSVTDHEEYILSRIMEIIAAEPGFDHTVSSHPCNILVFPVPPPPYTRNPDIGELFIHSCVNIFMRSS